MSAAKPTAVSLLFCHGGGFCGEVWAPIIRRLRDSELFQRVVAAEMRAFDFPYHGRRRDVSTPAVLYLENAAAPRVTHPAMHWLTWSMDEVARQLQALGAHNGQQRAAPIIGIGHSLGGAALWATEIAHPGAFQGLILFEPICNLHLHPEVQEAVDFLVGITLRRKCAWATFEEAEADLLTTKYFSRWHEESVRAYARGAVVRASPQENVFDPHEAFVLSCHPHIEASGYCGPTLELTPEAMGRVRCPVTMHYGDRTQLFFAHDMDPIVAAYPTRYRRPRVIPRTSHALILEDPDITAQRILEDVAALPFITEARGDEHHAKL